MAHKPEEPGAPGEARPTDPSALAAWSKDAPPPGEDEVASEASDGRSKLATAADAAADVAADFASTIVDAAQAGLSAAQAGISAARPLIQGVDDLATGARRAFGERSGARVRRVRMMAREPLRNLWDVHPEARRASIRELGLQTVPVDQIAGTAVEGAPQRGGDFLPLPDRRSDDWRSRWQRILKAADGLVNLPPVELIRFGDEYWVVDGHNRVAAALYNGQVAMDAVVDDLRLPGMDRDRTPTRIASALEGSHELRQAATGRLNRTSARPDRLPVNLEPAHDHGGQERERDEDHDRDDSAATAERAE